MDSRFDRRVGVSLRTVPSSETASVSSTSVGAVVSSKEILWGALVSVSTRFELLG